MNDRSIPTLLDKLVERLGGQEALELEFKAAKKGLPRSLWETISAFANTSGGWILLGIGERVLGNYTVEGVTDASAVLKTFFDLLRNPQKISYPICSAADAAIELLGDKQIVALRISAAPRKARPVYVGGNPYTGTYVRRHSGDYHCTKQEVDRMMREASDVAADSTVLTHFDLDDLDRDTLARYRRRFQTQNPGFPFNSYDDQQFLKAIGGWRRDREKGQEGITAAGLLMFGTPDALREWRTRHLIDYRLTSGDSEHEQRWDDRITWEGNLFAGFETIYPRLIAGQLVPFRLEGSTRVDETPVHVALREALVNLLAHADYTETDASLIKRSPEGYLFRNPGNSRVAEDDLLTGDRSDPRNPVLVQMFRLIGLAEEAGTGIPKIMAAWRELGFRIPAIDVGTERYEFILSLRHAHLLLDEDRTWLRSLGEGWSEAEQLALVIARHEGGVDNLKLRSLTGQHPADVTKILGSLRDRKLLEMIGGRRVARYQLGPLAIHPLGPLFGMSGAQERGTQAALAGGAGLEGLGHSIEDLDRSIEDSGVSIKDLGHSIEDFDERARDAWIELEQISREARERRYLDPAFRDGIIIGLCSRAPLSLRELAILLGRSEAHVREVVRALVAADRLFFLHPERPKHPNQKYTADADLFRGE